MHQLKIFESGAIQKTLFKSEDESEVNNNRAIRRIKLMDQEVFSQDGTVQPDIIHQKGENLKSEAKLPKVRKTTAEEKKQETPNKKKETPLLKMELKILTEKIPLHLKGLYRKSSSGRTLHEKTELARLLIDYQDVFSKDEHDIGLCNSTEHVIETGDARPIRQPFRRTPMAFIHEEKAAIDKLLEAGVIQESTSPWGSPIVLVRKKDGSVRPCVDYRRVNAVTKADCYPIPKVQECLDTVAGAAVFSTLDMTSGYHQIPVRTQDIPKTAFVTKHGHFEFRSMPFGLNGASSTFQRTMELVLKGLNWITLIVYIDDVIVFSSDFLEHIQRLKEVLDRFRQANMKLKPEKCELFKPEVTFLGHRVSKEGVKPDPNNIAKIMQWLEPSNVTEVKQFLGIASYYRRFVRDFSDVAKPLTDLTKNESDLIWTTECQEAFNALKGALTGTEVMACPNDTDDFVLDVDASDFGIGAVLTQIQEGKERVVSYASRTLNKAERNYCVTDKELLAVRYFVEYFRHYLLGRKFLVRSDHQCLRWLFSLKNPSGRIARWIEILSAYNFSIEYRKGRNHGNSDGMSRCPNPQDCTCAEGDTLEILKCGPCKKCQKRAA